MPATLSDLIHIIGTQKIEIELLKAENNDLKEKLAEIDRMVAEAKAEQPKA